MSSSVRAEGVLAAYTLAMVRVGAGVWVVVVFALSALPARGQSEEEPGAAMDVPVGDGYADTDPSALTDFRPALDPHGTWVDDPTYGTVWTPDPSEVGEDFEPYATAGQWDYVDGDYSWVSDYAWGWVCFHYGRWVWSSGRWAWIAGREYAPSWVDWRVGDDEYGFLGWAPLPPAWIWLGGGAVGSGFSPPEPYAFSAFGDVFGPGLSSRLITGERAVALIGHTHPYVRAAPVVPGQRVPPTFRHGPPLAMLGTDLARLPHPLPNARETRARQYARPVTAQLLGAHPPSAHVFHAAPRGVSLPRGGFTGGARGAPRGRR